MACLETLGKGTTWVSSFTVFGGGQPSIFTGSPILGNTACCFYAWDPQVNSLPEFVFGGPTCLGTEYSKLLSIPLWAHHLGGSRSMRPLSAASTIATASWRRLDAIVPLSERPMPICVVPFFLLVRELQGMIIIRTRTEKNKCTGGFPLRESQNGSKKHPTGGVLSGIPKRFKQNIQPVVSFRESENGSFHFSFPDFALRSQVLRASHGNDPMSQVSGPKNQTQDRTIRGWGESNGRAGCESWSETVKGGEWLP